MSSCRNPHFFKLILGDTLRLKMLSIPEKFISKYGESLSKTVHLKLPCGTEWEMWLIEHQGRVWLKEGWPEFTEHYSIAEEYLLTFRYRGDSRFHVAIFDTTTVEINYPLLDRSDHWQRKRSRVKEDPVEIFDDIEAPSSPSPRKRARASQSDDPRQSSKKNKLFTEPSAPRRGKSSRNSSESSVNNVRATLLKAEKEQILERVRFKSARPFFKSVMQPTSVSRGMKYTPIPTDFARRHIKKRRGACVLRVPNKHRKTWSIGFISLHPGTKQYLAYFQTGWKKFAESNALKIGDACVFELVDETKYIFNVHVFRFPSHTSKA